MPARMHDQDQRPGRRRDHQLTGASSSARDQLPRPLLGGWLTIQTSLRVHLEVGLSARAHHRTLEVARTIADQEGATVIRYRALRR